MAKALQSFPPKKISVRIWKPILEKLEGKMEAACLRRDAYLAKVLEVELDCLDQEVSLPNSHASFNYVAKRLDELDRKLVSLALPPELVTQVDEICSRKRIVRDAFFNRLFLLLAASPKVIDSLLFSDASKEWRTRVWSERRNDGPFFQNGFCPLEPVIDPFWAVREGLMMAVSEAEVDVEDFEEPTSGKSVRVQRSIAGDAVPVDSLYTIVFQQKVAGSDLFGLNCYLPDWHIPGHAAEQEHNAKLDELILGDLVALQ